MIIKALFDKQSEEILKELTTNCTPEVKKILDGKINELISLYEAGRFEEYKKMADELGIEVFDLC
jgi:hypothetical protein